MTRSAQDTCRLRFRTEGERRRCLMGYTLPELIISVVVLGVLASGALTLVGQLAHFSQEAAVVRHRQNLITDTTVATALGFGAVGSVMVPGGARGVGGFISLPQTVTATPGVDRLVATGGGYVIQAGSGLPPPVAVNTLNLQVDIMPLVNVSQNDTGAQYFSAARDLNWTTLDPSLRFRAQVINAGAKTAADFWIHWTVNGADPTTSSARLNPNTWRNGNTSQNPDLLDYVSFGSGPTVSFTLKVRAIAKKAEFANSPVISLPITLMKVAPVVTLTRTGVDTSKVELADVYRPATVAANRLRIGISGLPASIATPSSGQITLATSVGGSAIASGSLVRSTDPASPAAGAIVTSYYDFQAPASAFQAGSSSSWTTTFSFSHPLVYSAVSSTSRLLTPASHTLPAVTISPPTGTFTVAPTVHLTSAATVPDPLVAGVSNTAFLTLRYTRDDSNPTVSSTAYTGPFTISETTSLAAANVPQSEYAAFFGSGTVERAVFTISPPSFSPLYLRDTGVPESVLSLDPPTAAELRNFDPARDAFGGLLIVRGGAGAGEFDETKHQSWLAPLGQAALSGPLRLSIWTAMKNFDPTRTGSVTAYVIDRGDVGSTVLASKTLTLTPWADSGTWVQRTFDFGPLNHAFAANRRLEIKVVVDGASEDDMWFAYDSATFPSVFGPP